VNKSTTKGLPYLKHLELIAFWLGGGVGEVDGGGGGAFGRK